MTMLERTHFHIIPQLNVDGVRTAVESDCSGASYGGVKLDDTFDSVSVLYGTRAMCVLRTD